MINTVPVHVILPKSQQKFSNLQAHVEVRGEAVIERAKILYPLSFPVLLAKTNKIKIFSVVTFIKEI